MTVCAYQSKIGVDLREYGRGYRFRSDDGQAQYETDEDDEEADSFKVPTKKGAFRMGCNLSTGVGRWW